MEKIKVGSMFAGVGGVCYGFKEAGAQIIWANELDKFACMTYSQNFGNGYLVEGDIKDVCSKTIPDIDILTAGFPCQAFSIAGNRKGFDDERGNLFFQVIRILKDKKPKAFLLENVKNLLAHNGGRTFRIIQDNLRKEGYYIKHAILNTCEYGDIPQNRERIYVVGFKDETKCDAFLFPDKVSLSQTIHDIIDIKKKQEEKYYYDRSKYYPILKEAMQNKNTIYQWRRIYVRENKNNVCPTLTANMGTGGHNVPLIIDDFGIRKLTPKECFMFQGFPDKFIIPDNISSTNAYKQAGNAVSVPVVRAVATQMLRVLDKSL